MEPIDIVIKWVDNEDPEWFSDYSKYKNLEIQEKRQSPDNEQAFGVERIRNWHILKYWFRSIEKNCPWARKIFLIVQRESQLPKWLNTACPKLVVVTHDKFIPKDLLPTFNTWIIEMFTHRIPNLSDKFISFDDDFFTLNPISPDMFFEGDKPIVRGDKVSGYNYKGIFGQIMTNTFNFEKKIFPSLNHTYSLNHLPVARRKSLEKNIVDKYYNEIVSKLIKSKFRHPDNITHLIFPHIELIQGDAILKNNYSDSIQITLSNNVDYNGLKKYKMVCFNDAPSVKDFDNIKNKLIHFLNLDLEYWNYSSFEKYDYKILQDKRKPGCNFSILIPAYNCEKFVQRLLDSLPKRADIEIIVENDGSKDNTLDILKGNKNITIIDNSTNFGIGKTRNILLDEASGKYIMFLDSDDFVHTNVLNNVLDLVLKNNFDVYRTRKEKNDGTIYWGGVWIGMVVRKSLLDGIKIPDMIIDEDKFIVQYARDHHKDLKEVKGPEVYYHYNYPNVDSLAWRYLNHLNDGRSLDRIRYVDKIYNKTNKKLNVKEYLKVISSKPQTITKSSVTKNIEDGIDTLDNWL